MDLPLLKNNITSSEPAFENACILQKHAIGIRYGFVGDNTIYANDNSKLKSIYSAWTGTLL